MHLKHLKTLALAAIAGACLFAVDRPAQAAARGWWSARCYRRSTTAAAAPSAAAAPNAAQANRSVQRRYSFAPSQTYSAPAYAPSRNSPGMNGSYRPGPGYSPRNGINRADFKIRGL